MTIKDIEDKGLIAYKYMAGSYSQNLYTEGVSDIDYHGVYFAPIEAILGLGADYQEEVSDEKHDETYHEFGKWMTLLSKGNPNALESLFVPEEMVVGEIHPTIKKVLENKDKFVSKQVVKALSQYACGQIGKAKGLGKKIVNPIEKRLDILDFCYTYKGQGSQPIKEFLAEHKLDQRYCGLVKVPNMPEVYGVYYDFAAYWHFESIDDHARYYDYVETGTIEYLNYLDIIDRINDKKFFGYSGIAHPDEIYKSNNVRLSSIPKGEEPICTITYNKNAYECHCREYKEYQEWKEKRNPKRYSKAEEAGYNQKNMCHCVRLLTMAKEISEGKGFNLWRTDDRDFLMGIKNGDYTYEYLIEYAEKLLADVNESLPKSDLPDEVDKDFVNNLMVECRKSYYRI